MIRVSEQTRDRVRAISAATGRTADQVLNEALEELEWSRKRAQLRRDSERLANDPVDQAAVAEVIADMDALSAW